MRSIVAKGAESGRHGNAGHVGPLLYRRIQNEAGKPQYIEGLAVQFDESALGVEGWAKQEAGNRACNDFNHLLCRNMHF